MKNTIRSYFTFTRKERIGIICLCGIIILLIAVRASLVYWVHPQINVTEERKLQAAYHTFLSSQPKEIVRDDSSYNYLDKGVEDPRSIPQIVNINTADSATLVCLKGIGPTFAHKIIQKRKKGHLFKSIDELSGIQFITQATMQILKQHLIVADSGLRN